LDENPGGRGAPDATEFTLERPFGSLFDTTRDVLLSPRRFFDELPPDGPLWPPVLYFLICYLATTLISLVATASLFAVPAIFVAVAGTSEARAATSGLLIFFVVFVLLSLAFFVLVAVLFFASVPLQHAFVFLIAGRDQRGLRATLRLSCYAVGAPIALGWIPVVGFLAVFYCPYLYTTALKRVHGISTGKTLGAILIPLLLSLILAAFGIFLAYRAAQDADLTSRPEVSEVRSLSTNLSPQARERHLDGLLG
jgi:Yip1 domain